MWLSKNEYYQRLKDPRWQKKRLDIMDRDNFSCQICGATKKTLNIHHKRYLVHKEIWDVPDSLLVTLCEDCHQQEAENLTSVVQDITSIIRQKFFSNSIYTLTQALISERFELPENELAEIILFAFTDDKTINQIKKNYRRAT